MEILYSFKHAPKYEYRLTHSEPSLPGHSETWPNVRYLIEVKTRLIKKSKRGTSINGRSAGYLRGQRLSNAQELQDLDLISNKEKIILIRCPFVLSHQVPFVPVQFRSTVRASTEKKQDNDVSQIIKDTNKALKVACTTQHASTFHDKARQALPRINQSHLTISESELDTVKRKTRIPLAHGIPRSFLRNTNTDSQFMSMQLRDLSGNILWT